MRLFVDQHSPRRIGETLLLLSDLLGTIVLVLFLSRVMGRESPLQPALFLIPWAVVPRSVRGSDAPSIRVGLDHEYPRSVERVKYNPCSGL